jgi:hypothetical protein
VLPDLYASLGKVGSGQETLYKSKRIVSKSFSITEADEKIFVFLLYFFDIQKDLPLS